MFRFLALSALSLLVFSGCDDSEELTCEVLAQPDFCWTVAVEEAYACTAQTTGDCLLTSDYAGCAYENGITASFSPPMDPMVSVIDIENIDITVNNTEGQCARFVEDEQGMTLTTASGTVDVGGTSSYRVECPDGTVYATDNAFDLLNCGEGGLFDSQLPGSFKSGSGLYRSFGINPAPEDSTGWLDTVFPEGTATE